MKTFQILGAGFALLLAANSWALSPYSTDFEDAPASGDVVPIGDGWLNAINQFNTNGTYNSTYAYAQGLAPASGPQVSGIALGEGGPDQGDKVLNVYSDYDNVAFHTNGNPDAVETNVFQEQFATDDDVGTTWTFRFNAKAGNLEAPASAKGFIKAFAPGFALLDIATVDTTLISPDWQGYEVSLTIPEGTLLVQFGFLTSTGDFVPSANFYDNVAFFNAADPDADGVESTVDNCTEIANNNQLDTDNDGFGDACDPDFDQSCAVNFADFQLMSGVFFQSDPLFDLDGSGTINFSDLQILTQFFFQAPGPSGIATCDIN